MGVIFRSSARIELSPYKQSVYYSNHTNDIIMAELFTAVNKLNSMVSDNELERTESVNNNAHISKSESRSELSDLANCIVKNVYKCHIYMNYLVNKITMTFT